MVANGESRVSAIVVVFLLLFLIAVIIIIPGCSTLRTTVYTTRSMPSSQSTVDLSQANCRKSLGMQGGSIEDRHITASSSYDFGSVGPANARIRTEKNGGAWCPRQPITKDSYEWIQVDLVDLKVITQVETQGRFGSGQGQEYVEQYRLEFKRKNSGQWMRYKDKKYNEIFKGNNNTYIAELREINPPLVARRIRIVPIIALSRTVCLRFELYGCAWRDGVVSYGMPQGDEFLDDLHLYDYTYDGQTGPSPARILWGGLGQLTDGAEGHSNFRLDPDGSGKKGYEWVGWKNETGWKYADDDGGFGFGFLPRLSAKARPSGDVRLRRIQEKSDDVTTDGKTGGALVDGGGGFLGGLRFNGSVRVVFEFDRLRNFSACRVHCNNMFSKEVRLFKRATLHFSLDGTTFKGSDVINFENTRDSLIEFARNVVIPIPRFLGRVVVLELHHDSRWIMISEVRFESDIANNINNDNEDDDNNDEGLTGSELRNGHLGSEREVLHPSSNPSLHSSILSFDGPGDDDNDDRDDDDDDGGDNNGSLKNSSTELGQQLSKDDRHQHRQHDHHHHHQQHTNGGFSTAFLDRVVGVISGIIVALLFVIIFVIVLYATKKNSNHLGGGGGNRGNNNNGSGDHRHDRKATTPGGDHKSFRSVSLCCRCCPDGRYNLPENDGAKKASLDLSICDSTSWPPTMRKVVSNGNTYSNLSSNGCPGDGLPMTTDDVIWRADRFLLGGNNRKLPDLPGKLFLESSLMADTCDLMSASSTYAIPELSRVEALKRKNSFCQSKSSPHLHPKTPPFSIFIPPPPPIQPTSRKTQAPVRGLPDRDFDAANQKAIHSLRHGGQAANRCPEDDPSNNSAAIDDDDFLDLVTSKLGELNAPLLCQNDVIFLQCLGSGEFGQLHLGELRKREEEEEEEEELNEGEDKDDEVEEEGTKRECRALNTTPHACNNINDNSNVVNNDDYNNKNSCSTSASGTGKSSGFGPESAPICVRNAAFSALLSVKDNSSLERSTKSKGQDSMRRRWTEEERRKIRMTKKTKKKKRFLVAVKSLKRDDQYRPHFLSEMERSRETKNNENIARLLGVYLTNDGGPSLVYEFTKHGDLVQFLRGCVLADQLPQLGPEADTLSHGCLTHLGCQVASGMKYLEKCSLVHGDLSARNCLVGPRRLVKICDLGRWRSSYRGDYYPPHPWSPPLPIRWMAWEAIHLNQMTSKSDVWSFGVTMWEILSLARLRPYHWLTDEQVLAAFVDRTRSIEVQKVESDDVTGSFSPQQHCWQQQQQQLFSGRRTSQNVQQQVRCDFRTTLQNIAAATSAEAIATTTAKPTTHPTIKTTTKRNNSQLKTRPQPVTSPKSIYSTLQQPSLPLGQEAPAVLLQQPIGCSKEIYDLLLECWAQDSGGRPSFADIHLFLLRYNDGHPNTPKNVASTIGTSRSNASEVTLDENDV